MSSHRRKPRVFIHEEMIFGRTPVSQIVEEAGCELVWGDEDRELGAALEAALPPLDLILLSLLPDGFLALESMAQIRKQDWLATIPILVVGSLDRSDLDLGRLRALGVAGLIDSGALPEHVRYRVGQVAYKGREGRRFERAPCCIPVEAELEGERITSYAVSLSVGGMGLACPRRIEPNTLLELRFSLEEGAEPVSISGRTVHVREVRRPGAEYQVGVFFHRMPDAVYREISVAVAQLLAAWDTVGGMKIGDDEAPPIEDLR